MAEKLTIHIGKTLRRLRKKMKFSQEELGFRSNLDRTYISLLERNKQEAGLGTIFSLAIGLEMKHSEFVKEIEENEDISLDLEEDEDLN